MKDYTVRITEQAYQSARVLFRGKENALHVLADEMQSLSYFPERGFLLPHNRRGKWQHDCLLIYEVIKPNIVVVLDVLDVQRKVARIGEG